MCFFSYLLYDCWYMHSYLLGEITPTFLCDGLLNKCFSLTACLEVLICWIPVGLYSEIPVDSVTVLRIWSLRDHFPFISQESVSSGNSVWHESVVTPAMNIETPIRWWGHQRHCLSILLFYFKMILMLSDSVVVNRLKVLGGHVSLFLKEMCWPD
jgi:hypothetical protein